MKLYLDNSFLNRPFDDPSIGTNSLEAETLSAIAELISKEKVELVGSSFIIYENSLNPFPERKKFVEEFMSNALEHQDVTISIRNRAHVLEQEYHLDPIDALHAATAEEAKVDYFITADYTLIKRYKGPLRIVTPLQFAYEYKSSQSQH